MPELPEVETTRSGIAPHIENNIITDVIVRNRSLRWPIPTGLNKKLSQQKITSVERRAKYLLIKTDIGTLIIHLGMSGSLRIISAGQKTTHKSTNGWLTCSRNPYIKLLTHRYCLKNPANAKPPLSNLLWMQKWLLVSGISMLVSHSFLLALVQNALPEKSQNKTHKT
jgi:hypothetical protein